MAGCLVVKVKASTACDTECVGTSGRAPPCVSLFKNQVRKSVFSEMWRPFSLQLFWICRTAADTSDVCSFQCCFVVVRSQSYVRLQPGLGTRYHLASLGHGANLYATTWKHWVTGFPKNKLLLRFQDFNFNQLCFRVFEKNHCFSSPAQSASTQGSDL